MCGIFGIVNFNKTLSINKTQFVSALDKMSHRGPDASNCLYYDEATIGLGHVRLSIIDLSSNANQPMKVGEKYTIVFNGEIYNYLELKEFLITKNYTFTTNSDTEVLVNSYDYWGEECVHKFNGMWAFVIYDIKNESFFCSRDRFGVKPFVYKKTIDYFVFSSEIKSILSYFPNDIVPDYKSISSYCLEGSGAEFTNTWFEGIYRLQPGHNLILSKSNLEIKEYYQYPSSTKHISLFEARKEFLHLLTDAVNIRMRSDVPVGITLSGGLDSTSIVSVLREKYKGEIQTFTAHFPKFKDDELKVAVKTNEIFKLKGSPIEVKYNNDDYIPLLEQMIYHLESGNLSPSIFPLWKIYEFAKKDVTVLLEGQGADELLGGYIQSYSGVHLLALLKQFAFKPFFRDLLLLSRYHGVKNIFQLFVRNVFSEKYRSIFRRYFTGYDNILIGNLKQSHKELLKLRFSNNDLINTLIHSHRTTLSNLLHYGDAISMAHSLENRLPFLDYRLVNFSLSLPSNLLISSGKGKFILRESLKDILPAHIYADTKKLGFPSPINDFMSKNKALIRDILFSEKCKNRNLFDHQKLSKIINTNFEQKPYISRFIFRLISVELWFRIFIDNNKNHEN